jgi:hypothetical protein
MSTAFAPETIPATAGVHPEELREYPAARLKAGVKLAMGSDAVYSMFGQNTRELGWFVKPA